MSVRAWKHCPRCGDPLTLHAGDADVHVACAACAFVQYENPVPTSIVVVLRGDEVLLVRRAQEPQRGEWDTVGGFLELGETAEACARREVREELGCELTDLRPVGTFTSVYGEGGRQTIAVAFTAALAPGAEIVLSEENLEHRWFGLRALPARMAFPDGRDAVAAVAEHRPAGHEGSAASPRAAAVSAAPPA